MWLFASLKTQPARPSRRVPSSFRPRLEALEDRCLLNAGDLDTSFGGTGIVTTSLSNNNDNASAALIQSDGKIVAAGTTRDRSGPTVMGLGRYNTNGSLDSTFGSGGKVVSKIAAWPTSWAGAALYPQSGTANDGKIVVASRSSDSNSHVARFNANGSLDTSLNSHGPSRGSVTVPFVVSRQGVVIQPDGKIVVAGRDGPATEFKLTRFNADGSLDTSFGLQGNGTATLYLGPSTSANALQLQVCLRLQADGKLVVVGFTGSPAVWELARFNANGSLDTSFGSLGTVTTSFAPYGGAVSGLAIYPDGKIVAVGWQAVDIVYGPYQGMALARYNANGTIDTSFGMSGQVITSNYRGGAKAVALQADGKVVVAAQTTDPLGILWRWSLLRYNTDGSLDTTFGTGGFVRTGTADPANTLDWAVALQADGKIVAAGYLPGSAGADFMVTRYLGAASPTGAPRTILDPVPVGTDITPTADPVTAVAFQRDAVGDGVLEPGTDALFGSGTRPGDGTWTVSFATAGWASGRSRLLVQAQDSDGVFGDLFALPLL